MRESVQRVRLRCECGAVLARLQRRGEDIDVRWTGGKRSAPLLPRLDSQRTWLNMSDNFHLPCRCRRVYLLGRDQQAFDRMAKAAMTLAKALGSADVYIDDIAQPAKAISLMESGVVRRS